MHAIRSVSGLATLALLMVGCAHSQQVKAQPQVASAPPAPAAPAATPVPSSEQRPSLDPIHFDFDKSDIHPADQETLNTLGDYLESHTAPAVTVSGYCDERGTVEYNIALGDRRANAAREYLIRLGVDSNRVKTISYGSAQPVDPGHDEAAWAKNRRDEFQLKGGDTAAAASTSSR